MKILIIEDDKLVSSYLEKGLLEAGHNVHIEHDGKMGFRMAIAEDWDVMIVDRMLPSMEGLNIIKALRNSDVKTPALILSALGDVDHRVEGLRAGGDDYLSKPFAFSELLARLEVLFRRHSQPVQNNMLKVADLELDCLSREARRSGQIIVLQQREYALLEYMMRHKEHVVTRTMLLEAVWNYNFDPQTNVVDVHVSRLRQKIDKNAEQKLIHTVRGAGYVIKEAP